MLRKHIKILFLSQIPPTMAILIGIEFNLVMPWLTGRPGSQGSCMTFLIPHSVLKAASHFMRPFSPGWEDSPYFTDRTNYSDATRLNPQCLQVPPASRAAFFLKTSTELCAFCCWNTAGLQLILRGHKAHISAKKDFFQLSIQLSSSSWCLFFSFKEKSLLL